MKKNAEATALVSHNGIPTNWPGRIELWKTEDRYEVRGGGEIFVEGTDDFETLLDEATLFDIYGQKSIARLMGSDTTLELWKVEAVNYKTHEIRTKDGFIYPEHTGFFQKFAPCFGFEFA